ncbi:MAG: VWA domain-containing protein [Planctomycetota bacterium]|nr:MAG: VWA domain-containing protein [Planctomycetota bacterium]
MNERELGALLERAASLAWSLDEGLGLVLVTLSNRSRVAFAKEIETARIRRSGDGFLVEFDPEFARRYLSDTTDFLFVLAHEIMHRLQGDLDAASERRESPRLRLARNVVADIRINRDLLSRYFRGAPVLLRRLYGGESFLSSVLCPPDFLLSEPVFKFDDDLCDRQKRRLRRRLRRKARSAFERRGMPPALAKRLARWYANAWFSNRATRSSLTRELLALLPKEPGKVLLLGDHSEREDGTRPGTALGVLEELAEPLGWGSGDDLEEDRVSLEESPQSRLQQMRVELRRALVDDGPDPFDRTGRLSTPLPFPSRRDLYLLAGGSWPGVFRAPAPEPDARLRRAFVYLDVSGSTRAAHASIYALIHGLRDLVHDPIHVFSTTVVELPLRDLAEGRVPTTGGTSFTCVLQHAVKARARRILIITDGHGPLSTSAEARARKARLQVHLLLLGCLPPSSALLGLAHSIRYLPTG